MIVSIPKSPGDSSLSLRLNATFVVGDTNLIATKGRILVEDVSDGIVRGAANIEYDPSNSVNGRFEIPVCP